MEDDNEISQAMNKAMHASRLGEEKHICSFYQGAIAEQISRENHFTTANVRYYVKEKEPEPGAVRKGTSQPELDARSHEEVTPRNDASEKQNEIPGRQIPSQTDPLVEIRSAVHSNYAGMVATNQPSSPTTPY